jgi:peptide-methionine (R)-S-oxide reductase
MRDMSTSRTGFDVTPLAPDRIAALAAGFTDEERQVILHQGTERPFCGLFLDNKKKGVYTCRLCALPLFQSAAKFNSGTGWPSFFQPFDPMHVRELRDGSHGMMRTEIRCARCDAHLGHVFDDGPAPTHLRYCLNSVSMQFVDEGQPLTLRS